MRRIVVLLALVAGLVTIPAASSQASWVSTHCYVNNFSVSSWTRSASRAYADVASWEGYEWGGGCWNNNNRDDTPNAPDSGGEGPDCSGLVFKSWELKNSFGAGGGQYWDKMQDIHGPYTAMSYHNASTTSYPFISISKSRNITMYMDAFARDSHVGLLYTSVNPSSGTDWIIEAKGDAYGTNVFEESWRGDSAYLAVRRRGWSVDPCPQCGTAPATIVTVR
jgi:hypothetical protein